MSLISLVTVLETWEFEARLGPALRMQLNKRARRRSYVRVGDETSPEFEQWEIEGRLFRVIEKVIRAEIVLQEITYDEHDVYVRAEDQQAVAPAHSLDTIDTSEAPSRPDGRDRFEMIDPSTGEFWAGFTGPLQ